MNFSTTREHGSLEHAEPTEEENKLTGKIIGAAIDVHRILGPGLVMGYVDLSFNFFLSWLSAL